MSRASLLTSPSSSRPSARQSYHTSPAASTIPGVTSISAPACRFSGVIIIPLCQVYNRRNNAKFPRVVGNNDHQAFLNECFDSRNYRDNVGLKYPVIKLGLVNLCDFAVPTPTLDNPSSFWNRVSPFRFGCACGQRFRSALQLRTHQLGKNPSVV